jgi:hypothetical protein
MDRHDVNYRVRNRPVFFQFLHCLVLAGALVSAVTSVVSGQSQTVGVSDFWALLTIQSDGSLDVMEELTVRFPGDSSDIVRDLSLRPTDDAKDATD